MKKNGKRTVLLALPPLLAGMVLAAVVYTHPPAGAIRTPEAVADHGHADHDHADHGHEHAGHEHGDEHAHAGEGLEGLMCYEHDLLEAECAPCHPELAAHLAPGESVKMRLASASHAEAAGIRTGFAQGGREGPPTTVLTRVVYNGNRLAQVTPLATGVLKTVRADVGDTVKRGDVLAVVTAPDVARARAAYRSALAEEALRADTYVREKELFEKQISAKQDYVRAEAELKAARIETEAARQALRDLGVDANGTDGASELPVRAPFDATVVERNAVPGEAVSPASPLFVVADLSDLWLELAIPEDRVGDVAVGDTARARFDTLPGLTFEAEVAWLDSKVDPQDRTVKARAVIANPNGVLRQGMLGRAELGPGGPSALEVPVDAVQSMEGRPFVFVKVDDGLYELRGVALGRRDHDRVEILEGVSPREELVVARSYTLKSELLKARLGAGCAHD